MYKGIEKLAELIKLMAEDVCKERSWWKMETIGPALGLPETDDFFDEISVTDDSGYRAITIGDTRGNVSRVNGRKISESEHKGYMLLYSENCRYKGSKRIWKYKCFPGKKEIADRLQKVADKIPLIPFGKYNCDSEEFWYHNRDEDTLSYLSGVVKKYADRIASDDRTAKQIFDACMEDTDELC